MGSSVYVDHASDLSYIYHHTAQTSEETVKGKEAFKAYAKVHGVRIKHYHADNGRFKDNDFLNTAPTSLWMPSLCFTKGNPKWKESKKVAG
jgi:hypothetical protein